MLAPTSTTAVRTAATERPTRTTTARRVLVLVGTVALLAVLVVLSIGVGAKEIPFDRAIATLFSHGQGEQDAVVTGLRLPRTVLGILVGAALAVAGALIQALTRNPLADPGILGVNAGAALAVSVGIAFLGTASITGYIWLAFGGAIVSTIVVVLVGAAGRSGASPLRMTLAGVGLGAVFSGVTSAITLADPQAFQSMLSWSTGTLVGPTIGTSGVVAVPIVIGLALALYVARALNALGLGDDLAVALGTRTRRTRWLAVVAITLLTGAGTAAAGPITFVGLMIPHVARWIAGPDQRWIIRLSMTLGPCLLLVSDVLGRVMNRPAEIPVGLVTAFVGAPVLIVLVRRSRMASR